jgi:hypothetical protein
MSSLGAVNVAGAGDDDDFVFLVAADLGKRVAQLLMCGHAPFERTAFRMKDDLQNAVAPLHPNVLVAVLVIVEFCHRATSGLLVNRSSCKASCWTGISFEA